MKTENTNLSTEKRWKNDFLPNCRNKDFSARELAGALRFGSFWEKIPEEIKPYVKEELVKLRKEREQRAQS